MDFDKNIATAYLAFKNDPKEFLVSNRPSALKRLFSTLSKYEKEPETINSIMLLLMLISKMRWMMKQFILQSLLERKQIMKD